jgi:outer membrane protein TolC
MEIIELKTTTAMDFRKDLATFFLLTFMVLFTSSAKSQTIITSLPDSVIEQRLVDLAFKGPEVEKVDHENKMSQYQLKSARNSWMNFLTLSANFNESNVAPATPQATYVYPRYFFGVNVPLGTILSSKQAKIAKEGVEISTLTQEETKRRVKADVLGKWKEYKAQGEIIKIESAYLNDLEVTLTQVDEKFKKNDTSVTVETYNTALRNRNDQQAKLIRLKLEQDLTRLEIERIIGTSLETVLK